MNSVAISAASSSPVLGAESDLIRQAAKGNSEAFEELYRRHSQPAWRLAQAVAMDRDAATRAVREGFAKAVRSHRRSRISDAGDGVFRPQLLAAVYRTAAATGHEHVAVAPRARSRAKDADVAFAEAAFRSLPERWRAAVWLTEVESMETDRVAAVLGVSAAVATQLTHRGRRGLAGRYSQARQTMPEHIGPVLRKFALAVPANLADVAEASWSAAGSDRESLFAPITGWLEDRAIRPMWASVGGLLALGLIGVGVLAPTSPVRSNLGANGTHTAAGAIPVHSCYGIPCASNGGAAGGGSSLLGGFGNANAFNISNLAAASGVTGGASATGTTGSGATSHSGTSGTTSTGGSTGPTGGGGSIPGTITQPSTVLNLGPVGTVTQSGTSPNTSTSINLLPTKTGPTASVTVNCSTPIGITVGTTKIGCNSTSGSGSTSSGSGSTNPVTQTVTTVTQTVSGVLGKL